MIDQVAFDVIQEEAPFTSECVKGTTGACKGESFFREHEGKRYCVLHLPDADKKEAFDSAVKKKLESQDFNYQEVWFPNKPRFSGIQIDKPVDFSNAVFNDGVYFYNTTFRSKVKVEGAEFNEDARFGGVTFKADVDFKSVTFRKEADFNRARFEGDADFWRCTFMGDAEFRDTVFLETASFWPSIFNSTASFTKASFVSANFRASEFNGKAVFMWCAFDSATFRQASFSSDADFFDSRFEGLADFAGATFDAVARLTQSEFSAEARFAFTTFNGEADLSYTVFKDFVSFSGEHGSTGFGGNAAVDFRHARFEIPSRVSFHGLTLRPHWLVNLDPREFEFIDVKWIGNLTQDFIDIEIRELKKREELEEKKAADRLEEHRKTVEQYHDEFEIERLKRYEAEEARAEAAKSDEKRTRFYRLLSITCRQLAVNSEENHRYDQGSDFCFWSMELQRKEGWKARGTLTIGVLHSLYRYLSGYGEEILRALVMLIAIFLFFAFLYTRVGFVQPPSITPEAMVSTTGEVGQPQKPTRALVYSLAVITLQRPEPRPLTATAWSAVLAETILGPIQAALLILAVRRRFMR
jgi:uncharacterized protein YjbI with pentapeptide repeats